MPHRYWRRLPILKLTGVVVALLICASCSSGSDETDGVPTSAPTSSRSQPRLYTADWIVDAEAIGKDGPGYPYKYTEVIDDANGSFLAVGPQHLARQTVDQVIFCAGIFQDETRCASTNRPEGTPNVLGLGVATVRTWHPEEIYEVATYRRMEIVSTRSPAEWSVESDILGGVTPSDVSVECFRALAPDASTPTGLRLCYTSDENRLLASIDMNGDDILEVAMVRYVPFADEDELEISYPIIGDTKRYEQLLVIFPEIPIVATPVPLDEDGNPLETPAPNGEGG